MTPKHRILFTVPVYRESEREYFEYLNDLDEKNKSEMLEDAKSWGSDGPKKLKSVEDLTAWLRARKEGWRYNRIIGWLEFYTDGTTIKANLYFHSSKVIRKKLGKKIIEYDGKIADVASTVYTTNSELRLKIVQFLTDLQNGDYRKNLKEYYIDMDQLSRNLEFLDILGLIKKVNSTKKGKGLIA